MGTSAPTYAYTITFDDVLLEVGGTTTHTATVTPAGHGAVTYSIDDDEIATVNTTTGAITAKKAGTATITATVAAKAIGGNAYPEKTATCTLTVVEHSAYYYKKVTSASEIGEGEFLIVYESSTTAGMALDGSLGAGINKAGNYVSVTIAGERIPYTDETHNAALLFEKNGSDYNMKTMGGYYITANYTSSYYIDALQSAYAATVTYTGGTNKNVTIRDVYFYDKRSANVYLKYATGSGRFNYYTSGAQNVCLYKKYSEEVVEEDAVYFNILQYTMSVGTTYTQTATTTGAYASKEVEYSSSNPGVASVNSTTGEVTALTVGTTTITATVKGTEATATYRISVVQMNDSYYVKVTSAPANWAASGENEYLVVYETTANTQGNVMNGRGSGEETISKLQTELTGIAIEYSEVDGYYIQGNNLLDSCSFTIEKDGSSYYIKTTYLERYIGKHSSNALSQDNKRKIAHTITWDSGYPILQCAYNSNYYNLGYKTTGAFGYYTTGDSDRENISLFRKKNYMYDPEIYFANEEVYLGVGDTNTETVHKASGYDGTITYTSLNTDVAEVDPVTGKVTAKAQGQAIIVATGTPTRTYYGGSAQYKLMVSASGEIFTTSQQAIVARYEGRYYAMKNTIVGGAAEAIEVEVIHDGSTDIVVTPNVDDLAWTITGSQTPGGSITIQSGKTGKYLAPTTSSSSSTLREDDAPYEWAWTNHLYAASATYNNGSTKDGGADEAVKNLEKEGPYSQYGTSPYRTFLLLNGKQFKNYGTDNISSHVAGSSGVNIYSDVPSYRPMRYAYLMYPANGEAQTYVCTNADPGMKGASGNQNYVATLKVASVDESRVATAIPEFLGAKNTIINGVAKELDITDKVDYYAPYAQGETFRAEKVVYSRTNTKDWNSVCLPFRVNQAEIETLFGTGSKLYVLTSITKNDDDQPTQAVVSRVTGASDYVEAGRPCLVWCPDNSGWNIAAIAAREAAGVPKDEVAGSATLEGYFQKGILEEAAGVNYYKLAASGKSFGTAKAGSTVVPFRLALSLTGGAGVQALGIQFDENDEQELLNAIGEQLEEQERTTDGAIYDLSGRRVFRVTLPGIYVRDGKKFIKR